MRAIIQQNRETDVPVSNICLSCTHVYRHAHIYICVRYNRSGKLMSPSQTFAFGKLYAWRDKIAREKDESTHYVLPNTLMFKVRTCAVCVCACMHIHTYTCTYTWRDKIAREKDESTHYVLPNTLMFKVRITNIHAYMYQLTIPFSQILHDHFGAMSARCASKRTYLVQVHVNIHTCIHTCIQLAMSFPKDSATVLELCRPNIHTYIHIHTYIYMHTYSWRCLSPKIRRLF
jgi:hypothetical protein